MRRLMDFVEEHNEYYGIFNGVLDLNNAKDRQEIADLIDCALSPENLRRLNMCAKELLELDPSVTFYEYEG